MEVADDFDLDRIDSLVVRLLGHAHMARAYRDAIRRDPSLRAGFGRLAERHGAAVETLSRELGAAATSLAGVVRVAAPLVLVAQTAVR